MSTEPFNERLKKLRISKGLKQIDITYKTNISSSAYNYYENGKRQPTLSALCELADFFNVTSDYLLGRTNKQDGLIITILPKKLTDLGIKYVIISAERLYGDGLLTELFNEIYEVFKDKGKLPEL